MTNALTPQKPKQERIGVLLVNLGTPDSPTVPKVRDYLAEFLMDPYVVDIAPVFRWLLVHGIILRSRPAKSAQAYEKIWTDRGSPLKFHTEDLTTKVQALMGEKTVVKYAMRYGAPSIKNVILSFDFESLDRLVVFPLYPQYSLAATESCNALVKETLQKLRINTPTQYIGAFYNDPGFLDAFEERLKDTLSVQQPDFVLFSYHGLPERQVKKTESLPGYCLTNSGCCAHITDANKNCYRAQCFSTTKALAERLKLDKDKYSISFQSRLGRTPWIQPYTDIVIPELAAKGVRKLAIISPAFVADCLETLEELQIRARMSFIECGGQELFLVPSLNSSDLWAKAVKNLVLKGH